MGKVVPSIGCLVRFGKRYISHALNAIAMGPVQYQERFRYGASFVIIGGQEIPLLSREITYMRYDRNHGPFKQGYRQGLVFVLDESVDKAQVAASLKAAIAASLADKLALRDYCGNPFLHRLEIMATNDVELLRKEK